MHLYVKGCGTVPCGFNSARRGRLGFLGAYATATSHNVSLEESLCIFWTALLPRNAINLSPDSRERQHEWPSMGYLLSSMGYLLRM